MSTLAQDLLLVAAANGLVATLLALLAWCLLRCRQHVAAHWVCVLALVKLVTPPLVRLPLLAAPEPLQALSTEAWLDAVLAGMDRVESTGGPSWALAAVAAALLGSCLLAARAVLRTWHFRRMLRIASAPPAWLVARTRTLAGRMRLRRCPDLLVVPARISPMLCVLGARAHILLPHALLPAPAAEVDALLAHELAHASRRDHWVRALELLATVLYWWLPTAWFLRRTLRAAEERCCDERVMAAIPGGSRDYAQALLATLDLLAGTGRGMPPVACGAGAFTDMKTRLTMIMAAAPSRPMSWTLRAALFAGAIAVLPIAPIFAQERSEKPVSREELRAAREEIRKLRTELEALRAELNGGATGGSERKGRRQEPAEDDAAGKARIEKTMVEKRHREALDKVKVDHDHVRSLLEKLHGHDTGADAADAAKVKKVLAEKLYRDALEQGKVDHDQVRSLLEKLHGHDSGTDAADAARVKKVHDEKLHREGLDKAKVEHDHVRALLEKLHANGVDLDAADKAKIFESLHKHALDKAKVEEPKVEEPKVKKPKGARSQDQRKRADMEESEGDDETRRGRQMAR